MLQYETGSANAKKFAWDHSRRYDGAESQTQVEESLMSKPTKDPRGKCTLPSVIDDGQKLV